MSSYLSQLPPDLYPALRGYSDTYLSLLPRELREQLDYFKCKVTWELAPDDPDEDFDPAHGFLTISDGNRKYIIRVELSDQRPNINQFVELIARKRVAVWHPNSDTRVTYKPHTKTILITGKHGSSEFPVCPQFIRALQSLLNVRGSAPIGVLPARIIRHF